MTEFNDKDELRNMISRYLEGDATPEEIHFLEKYYEYFKDQKDGLEALSEKEQQFLEMRLLHQIEDQITPSGKRSSTMIYLRIAAAVALVVVVCGVFWKSDLVTREAEIAASDISEESFLWMSDTSVMVEKHVYLPDGSYVKMEPGSMIHYRKDFVKDVREVKLSGVAFFDVQHDSLHPFVVEAEGVSTRVLGTSFSISSPDQSDEFSITVTEGKVEVASGSAQSMEVLGKNDQLKLNRRTRERVKMKLKEEKVARFVPSEYIMDDMTLLDAVEIVEKWWNCKIHIDGEKMKNCRFTTSFLPTDELEVVIAVISGVIGADYEIADREVTLTGKTCS